MKKSTRKGLKNSLIIFIVGMLSAFIPYGILSMVFGTPAVIVSTIIVSVIFRKELGYNET